MTIRATQAGDSNYAAAPAVERTFVVRGESLGSWRSRFFSAVEQSDATLSGPAGDPDGDGVNNLLEYALGLEPRRADASAMNPATALRGLPLARLETSGSGPWLTLEFMRRTAASLPGITYVPECTSNLADPQGWSAGGSETVTPVDPAWERVKVTAPQGGEQARGFGRLRVNGQ